MSLQGKRIAVLVDQLYQELEVWYPYYRLKEAGAEVHLVGAEAGKNYPSKVGYPAIAEKSYTGVQPSEYDGVIAPGGFAPDFIRRHPEALHFVHEIDKAGKLVAAICHGPWVLCSSNMLRGRKATSFFAIKDDVIHAGAEWSDAEVVVDRNLVTSRKPDDLPAFCIACIDVLNRQ
ncbi:type 1 glutamine amidotransferase domain-containing protein [Bryobacter aggregatus]|uniref:type 1 glutamine amidotransferase domain-containing protein n=1 Tax=Bryobacter aggregatus TaxID=360054 RepID=UPI0004E14174|nr:type 1 glutamine amidotransferase domain-containing protein [Bryobacter aggregatus]